MSELLKSTDPYERQRAIEELIEFTTEESQVVHILDFLIGRIEDTLSVDTILNYLVLHKSKLTPELLKKIIQELNKTINVQSNPYNSRKNIFLLFEQFIRSCSPSPTFIELYTQSIDGEKDPRNLCIIFASTLKLIHMIDISKIRDSLYEVTSCYFPITFTSNADRTTDKLLKSLLQEILSSPHFLPLTIELIMDKIEAEPKQSLSLLNSSLDKAQSIPHLDKLQSILFEDIFVRCRPDAIPCMSKLVDNFPPLLEVVITKAVENMTPPDSRNARLASQLLSCCCSCPSNCSKIITNTALVFCSMYHSSDVLVFKSAVLDRVEEVLKGIQECEGFVAADLLEFNEKFLVILEDGYVSEFAPLRVSAFSNLRRILLIQGCFTDSSLAQILTKFTKAIHDTSQLVRECIITGIRELADVYTKECIAPGMMCDYICHLLPSKLDYAIKAILSLSESKCVDFVLHNILNQLLATTTSDDAMNIMDLIVIILKDNMLPRRIIDDRLLEIMYLLIDAFHEKIHYSQCDAILSKMVLLLTCCLSINGQLKLMKYVREIANIHNDKNSITMIECRNITLVYCSAMCGLRQYDFDDDLDAITRHFVKATTHPIFYECFSKVVANMLNKLPNNILTRFIDSLDFKSFSTRLNTLNTEEFKQNGLIYAWITKAAISKCHTTSKSLLQVLAALLNGSNSKMASKLFEIVFNYDDTLSNLNFCKIKSFAVQRMFYQVSEELFQYRSLQDEKKNNYLSAIFGFINNMSESIVLMEIDTLLPILIDALLVQELQLKALASLAKALPNDIDVNTLNNIIEKLLKCIQSNELQVKLLALNCLQTLGSIHNPLRFKDLVINALRPMLDDQKRIVRTTAIKVRYAYILLHS
eukprot:NODE_223_length_13915_cov_0.128257.p1 type:complete len:872 gc:universal NODE_223_length_13915_cov_0.128257:13462-10847(-)